MKQPDSIARDARRSAIAAGVDKDAIGALLLAVVGPALQEGAGVEDARRLGGRAQGRADGRRDRASPHDASSSSASRRFRSRRHRDARPDARQELEEGRPGAGVHRGQAAEDMFATSSIAMPAGAPSTQDAGQIMGAVGQYSDYIGQVKKAVCKCASERTRSLRRSPLIQRTKDIHFVEAARREVSFGRFLPQWLRPASARRAPRGRASARDTSAACAFEISPSTFTRDRLARLDRDVLHLHVVHALFARRARRA